MVMWKGLHSSSVSDRTAVSFVPSSTDSCTHQRFGNLTSNSRYCSYGGAKSWSNCSLGQRIEERDWNAPEGI